MRMTLYRFLDLRTRYSSYGLEEQIFRGNMTLEGLHD